MNRARDNAHLLAILENEHLEFDVIEKFLQASVDSAKACLKVTEQLLSKDEIYDQKIAIYQTQLLLTLIRSRNFTS